MARIRLEHVWKVYGKVEAVRDLSLDIRDGEFVVLLGPSGCGKTSTLRMIAGLEEVSAGEIFFDDKQVTKLPPAERNVAMAFENYALYPSLTVWDNVAFPLVARRVSKAEIKKRVQKVLEVLEIENLARVKPSQLSDGQKQRVGLARALVREPVVFLLDEPLSHLDARQRVKMRVFLKRFHQETGITMIMVTHDQAEALAVADRIAVMNEGRLEQIGSPVELYDRPRTLFVAGFIGEPPMNLLPCRVSAKDGRVFLIGQNFSVLLPDSIHLSNGWGSSEAVILGVRPEDLEVCETCEKDTVFSGDVE
ncbi:MAG: ABC transporter ATP-binding protein, partial [Candidatus Caldatribacterium sp.]|nr:ABC transporter ATP-binding protein [Candidatus Caldatribacterium sp.]